MIKEFCDRCDAEVTGKQTGAIHGIEDADHDGNGTATHHYDILCEPCYAAVIAFIRPSLRSLLITPLLTMPEEAFSTYVVFARRGYPAGLGGFRDDSRASIEQLRAAANAYLAASADPPPPGEAATDELTGDAAAAAIAAQLPTTRLE